MKTERPRLLPGAICDVKHTLYDNDCASEIATNQALEYARTAQSADFDVSTATRYVRETISKLKEMQEYAGDINKIKRTRKAFQIFMDEFGVELSVEQSKEMERKYTESYFDERFFYADVKRTLPELYKTCILGVNTSCDETIGKIVKEMPFIKDYFGDRITIAGETGRWTKDKASIKDTLDKMKTDPKKTLMIGDIRPDFIGANELGMPTILIKRHPITDLKRAYNEPDLTVNRFDEILCIAKLIDKEVPIEKIIKKVDEGIPIGKIKL